MIWNIFFHVVGCLFVLMVSFAEQNSLVSLVYFHFCCLCFWCYIQKKKNNHQNQCQCRTLSRYASGSIPKNSSLQYAVLIRSRDSACAHELDCVRAKLLQSCLTLSIPWTITHQAPLSMGFSRQQGRLGSSWPKDQTHISCLLHWQVGSLPLVPTTN